MKEKENNCQCSKGAAGVAGPGPSPEGVSYDYINPSHYKNYSVEVIEMIVCIYGVQAAIQYCEINAFKYRMRMGTKPGNSIEQDLKKERWYLDKANQLRNKTAEALKEADIKIQKFIDSHQFDYPKSNNMIVSMHSDYEFITPHQEKTLVTNLKGHFDQE